MPFLSSTCSDNGAFAISGSCKWATVAALQGAADDCSLHILSGPNLTRIEPLLAPETSRIIMRKLCPGHGTSLAKGVRMNRLHHLRHPVFVSQAIVTIVVILALFSVAACQEGGEAAVARTESVDRSHSETAAEATGRYIMEAVWIPRIDQAEDY
jgi:hypothetical protein